MTAPRLCDSSLTTLAAGVGRPAYDRADRGIGVVHFGPGAFHRAHQAVYFDDALALGGDWAICAVALRSRGVPDALSPQDGLYTLVTLDRDISFRVIGSIREVLCAEDQRELALERLAAPGTRIVTMTVTEKGYCLAGAELDLSHPDIVHDLAAPQAPVSVVGMITEGLRRRRAAGTAPYTVISCDNLVDNGQRLGRAVVSFARQLDAALAEWIEREVAFPSTMIDSITPATDDALRARVEAATGLADAWPIQREAFTQWVIEDRFCNERPDLAAVGVLLTQDVGAFDRAKLRILNGPHSTLAYLGSLLELETVHDAMSEPALAAFIERLMRDSILPTVTPPKGFDLWIYAQQILERFRNPAIRHLLAQIAWDGSQKLPFRLLGTVRDRLNVRADINDLCLPLAAWLHFIRRRLADGAKLVDPKAEQLLAIAAALPGNPEADVAAFLKLDAVFGSDLPVNAAFVKALTAAYGRLGRASRDEVLAALN